MSTTLQDNALSSAGKHVSRIRLEYLDGLRGIAALYVLVYHATAIMPLSQGGYALSAIDRIVIFFATYIAAYGRLAVVVFIVLSGYCLMLPIVYNNFNGRMPGGIWQYIKRRTRRILPPYYAALALSLLATKFASWISRGDVKSLYSNDWPVFKANVLLPHIFLVQNWGSSWTHIDPPMWSVAAEWQIYFLFPLLLLPLWRRFGSIASVLIAVGIGLVPHYLFHRFDDTSPWFLGMFALGMLGATMNFPKRPRDKQWSEKSAWGKISGFLFLLIVIIWVLQRKSWAHSPLIYWFRLETWGSNWPLEMLTGCAAICLIIGLTQEVVKGTAHPRNMPPTQSRILCTLNSSWATKLGSFSYSLYLCHAPILAFIGIELRASRLSPALAAWMNIAIGIPLSLILAYLFHLAFERPFMTRFEKAALNPTQSTSCKKQAPVQ